MIGLSTSLLEDYSGKEIISKAKELGFSIIEMAFRLKPDQVQDIIKFARTEGIQISSLHNFVPEPPETEGGIKLSDIDESARNHAIELTIGTIKRAAEIGAGAVVLHMGEPRGWAWSVFQKELRQAIFDNASQDQIIGIRQKYIEARKRLPEAYLDSMLLSLDRLAPMASELGIKLGIENRYSYGQFPNFEELGILLQEFSGSSIGYWHDCGHAANNKYCGFASETENLNTFGNRLVGIHLHDAHDWHDHQIPGPNGDINFDYLKSFIKADTILVLELAKTAMHEQICGGIEYLNNLGIK
jgi:sugar phosphate isomerase/epimerase